MRIAWFDCSAGVAGDMILGALLDAGLPAGELRRAVSSLGLEGCEISTRPVQKGFLRATKADVKVPPGESRAHRHLTEILARIRSSGLPEPVREQGQAVFRRLAGAEAKIHGIAPEEVHFHEVGAADAIVDVIGSLQGLHALGVEAVYASPVSLGRGAVTCSHGSFVSPAPAALELLLGASIRITAVEAELTTPTGAAILSTIARGFGEPPLFRPERVGYGAGDRDLAEFPNALRVVLGEMEPAAERDRVVLLETNLDDQSPEVFSHLIPALLEAGALDAWLVAAQMKKGRPGVVLSVLAEAARAGPLEERIFRETSTFGIRRQILDRRILARESREVATPWGKVRVKVGRLGGEVLKVSPEYEDCARAAREGRVPLFRVYEAAVAGSGAGGAPPPPAPPAGGPSHLHPHPHPRPPGDEARDPVKRPARSRRRPRPGRHA